MYIPTFTGKRFDFMNPRIEDIDVLDIAHSLACLPRYLGHTVHPYYVAEHCVRMTAFAMGEYDCSPVVARRILFHDGAGAYLGEWPKPLKLSPLGEGIRKQEPVIQEYVYAATGCEPIIWNEMRLIEAIDRGIVFAETELSGQMAYIDLPIKLSLEDISLGYRIYAHGNHIGLGPFGWKPDKAEYLFLSMATKLGVIEAPIFPGLVGP